LTSVPLLASSGLADIVEYLRDEELMRHRTVMILSGVVTAFVLVAVIGLFGLSAKQSPTAQAASPAVASAGVSLDPSGQLSTDVPTLQAEVVAYQQQLDQAYQALQQAYAEIQVLQAGGARRFRNGGGSGNFQFFNGGSPDD
jgi:hypothetical protein